MCDAQFGDDWTPAHLTGGPTNLYKEIAFALKGVEWRQPGLVAVASKIAASAAEHKPIDVVVPDSYEPKQGPNKWKDEHFSKFEALVKQFDFDRGACAPPNATRPPRKARSHINVLTPRADP